MKYRVAFYLKDRPPIEVLTIPKGRKGTFGPLPGQVSLSLVNAQWNGEEGIRKFIEIFAVSSINRSGREITSKTLAPLGLGNELELMISSEQGMMTAFIKDVLLPRPIDYPTLEEKSTDRRLAAFIRIGEHNQDDYFSQITMKPSSIHDRNIFSLEEKALKRKLKRHEKAWQELQNDFEADKPRQTLADLYYFTWKYESDNILSIAWLELFLMAEAGIKVKACRKCGNYYVPWPPNALHCPKCKKEYHSQKLYNEYVRENMTEKEMEIDRARKRIYMQEYRARKKKEREEAERLKKERGE